MADEQAVAKSLAEQLVDQKQQLEDNIRQTESQLSRLKEQYLKVLGALEFAEIQKQQETPVVTEETDVA